MKFGIRTPSLTKRIAARTSWKRVLRHRLGLKAPRGWGWVTNPKRAIYNRVYDRTSVSVDSLVPVGRKGRSALAAIVLVLFWPFAIAVWLLDLLAGSARK